MSRTRIVNLLEIERRKKKRKAAKKNRVTNSFYHQEAKSECVSEVKSGHVNSQQGLMSQLKSLPFLLLAFVKDALADTVYAKELSTNTNYKLEYDRNELPDLRSDLISYCKAVISDSSSLMYDHETNTYCVSPGGNSGPNVDIDVEVGKSLTNSFQDCLNQAMNVMCNDYYDRNTHGSVDGRTIGIILGVILGAIAIGACCYFCNRRSSNYNQMLNDLPPPDYAASTDSTVRPAPTVFVAPAAP